MSKKSITDEMKPLIFVSPVIRYSKEGAWIMTSQALQTLLLSLAERRKKLKMPLDALVKRSGLSRATVCRLLKGEHTKAGFLHVAALAEALGVELSFQQEQPEVFLDREAERQARRLVRLVQGNMALEGQGVAQGGIATMVGRTKAELLASPRRKLWYD
jgi:transcriptional regulator with XRE-family HTH domain